MLLDGVNHIAVLTKDTDQLHSFYCEVFDATIAHDSDDGAGFRFSIVDIGPHTELNVFEIEANTQAERQTPIFERGRLDHFGLQATSLEAFELIRERLLDRGAADQFVTDFGPVLEHVLRRSRRNRGRGLRHQPRRTAGSLQSTRYTVGALQPRVDRASRGSGRGSGCRRR